MYFIEYELIGLKIYKKSAKKVMDTETDLSFPSDNRGFPIGHTTNRRCVFIDIIFLYNSCMIIFLFVITLLSILRHFLAVFRIVKENQV